MKILYVYGDDDWAAVQWDSLTEKDQREIIHDLNHISIGSVKEFYPGCYVELLHFDEIDPDFIKFLRLKILDYDHCKHSNFYIL